MTNNLTVADIKPITKEQNDKLLTTIDRIRKKLDDKLEAIDIDTQHFIHAGCYVRNCFLPKGTVIGSALIKIPTVVIVSGDVVVANGENRTRYQGYKILKGSAFRRGVWFATEDTNMTMFFATKAKDTKEAEKEFTDEWEELFKAEE